MSETKRDLAAAFGCQVIEEPETPEGHKVPLWCDAHDSEWPCPEYQRLESVVEAETAYWRERFEDMAMRYERLGRQYDARWSSLARAWDEGARNGSRGVLPDAERRERNPYRDEGKFPGREYGGNGQAGPGDELSHDGYCTCHPDRIGATADCGVRLHRDRAEYRRLHRDTEGPVADDA